MNRNPAFDIMKGIALIAMIWEHCTIHQQPLELAFVCSFHMPLFYLLGGYFAKDTFSFDGFIATTKKNAKRLLLPCVVTMLLLVVWGVLQSTLKHDWSYVERYILSLLWFSGDTIDDAGLISVGPMWFLIALFWLRELFDVIQVFIRKYFNRYTDWIILGICTLISVGTTFLYPIVQPLPLGIMQGLCGLIFYAIGYVVQRHPIPWYIIGICIICWPLCILYGHTGMYGCSFQFPLDILGACGATYILYKISCAICS